MGCCTYGCEACSHLVGGWATGHLDRDRQLDGRARCSACSEGAHRPSDEGPSAMRGSHLTSGLCPKSCAKAVWPVAGSVSVGCLHGVTESGHVQVAAARPIVGGDVSDPGADEHERAPAVGEAADDPGAPADLPVEASESCCSCGSAAGAPGDTRRAARSWSRRYLPSGRRPPLSVSWTPSRGRPPRPWRGRTRVIPWRRSPRARRTPIRGGWAAPWRARCA